jgi:NADPH:quinone reductase-like Zn-dependent oxidoreductase
MKVVRFHQMGGPEVLQLEELPDPIPGSGEVLLKVRAAGLNRLDVFLRMGFQFPEFSLPHIGGFDFAGEVAALGPGCRSAKVGGAVMAKCRLYDATQPQRLVLLGINRPGAFAEYVVLPEANCYPKPSEYSFEEAAAFPCVYITASQGLLTKANMRAGEVVLVHGASGGAGMAAVQVAKLAGAMVIATAGSDAKLARVRELGADAAVNYRTQDVAAEVHKLTDGRGADVIYDPIWAATYETNVRAAGFRARWIVLGMVGGVKATAHPWVLMEKEITLHGLVEFYATNEEVDRAYRLSRYVRPVIDRVWPLEQLADAHRQMESGDFFGKIVVRP